MAYELTWLADVLRAGGLKVEEEAGWKDHGRGHMGTVEGVLLHHTAGARTGNSPSLRVVRDGRSDLPGPLSQLFLARDGTWHVVAAGRTNHAGAGSWAGYSGNSRFIGVEAENAGDGTDPWPDAQMNAYLFGVARLLLYLGHDAVRAGGHKEYATPRGRKIDPSFDMIDFRERLEDVMDAIYEGHDPILTPVASTDPKRSMLRKGDRGASVQTLQLALDARGFKLTADGVFGPATEKALREFQTKNGLAVDGLAGPKTWAALGVTNQGDLK